MKFISWYISTSFNGSQVWNIISDNSINLMHFYLMQPLMRVTSRSLFGNVGNLLNNVRPIYSCCQVLKFQLVVMEKDISSIQKITADMILSGNLIILASDFSKYTIKFLKYREAVQSMLPLFYSKQEE